MAFSVRSCVMTAFLLTLMLVLLVIVLLVTEVSFFPMHGNLVAITAGSSLLSSNRLKLSAKLAYALYGGPVRPANDLSDARSSQLLSRVREPNNTRSEDTLNFQHRKDHPMILPNLKTQYQAEESHRESIRVIKKTGNELHHFNITSSYSSTRMLPVQSKHLTLLGKFSSSSSTYDELKKNSVLFTSTTYPSDSTVRRKTGDIKGETPAHENVSRNSMEPELDEEDIGKFKIKKMVLRRRRHKKHMNNTKNSNTHSRLIFDSLEPKMDEKDIAKYKAWDISLLQKREHDQKDAHSISYEKISVNVSGRTMAPVSKEELHESAGKAEKVNEEVKEEEDEESDGEKEEGGNEEKEVNDRRKDSTDDDELLEEQDELTNKTEVNIWDDIRKMEIDGHYKTKPNAPSEMPELLTQHKNSIIKPSLRARAINTSFKMPCRKVYKSPHDILLAPWMKPLLKILNSVEGRQVTLVIANSLYKDVLLNWLISAITCKPSIENIVVVCLDRKLHQILIARDIPSILAPFSSLLNINYKFRRFFDFIMMMRLGFMRIINRLGYDCAMYDIDAIILKNPQTLYNKYNDTGIIGSRGSLPKSLMKKWKVTICIGAVFIRSNDNTETYWQAVYSAKIRGADAINDQIRLNFGLAVMRVRWKSNKYDYDSYQIPAFGTTKEGLNIVVLPFNQICRYNCRTNLRSQYYIWHKGGSRSKEGKKNGAAKGHTWFLREDWSELSRKNLEIKGTNWLKLISTTH